MALRITKRLLSNNVTGKHHKQIQTVAGWFASHEQGRVKDVIDDMASDPSAPVQVYGGRGTVQLTSVSAGKEFLKNHGEDPPTMW